MKMQNRKYVDQLTKALNESHNKLTVTESGMMHVDYNVMYYMAKATGLRSRKVRKVKKRFKKTMFKLLDELAEKVNTSK